MTHACTVQIIGNQSCIVCPEVPFVAAVPARTLVDNNYGWNASAISYQRHAGDCYTEFSMPDGIGTVVGLAPERRSSDPRDVPHAIYAYESAGRDWWVVSEAGVPKTTPVARVPATDTFRIERRNGAVRYFHNNRQVYVSATPQFASLVVVACMYAAGDGVN